MVPWGRPVDLPPDPGAAGTAVPGGSVAKAQKKKSASKKKASKKTTAKKKTATKKKTTKKTGRPSKYDHSLTADVKRLAEAGATDLEIAEEIGVTERTVYHWKKKHPDFFQALKEGKDPADDLIETSLFLNALNGDTTAQIFWLKNRRPDQWRDAQQREHSGPAGGPIPHEFSAHEIQLEIQKALKDGDAEEDFE